MNKIELKPVPMVGPPDLELSEAEKYVRVELNRHLKKMVALVSDPDFEKAHSEGDTLLKELTMILVTGTKHTKVVMRILKAYDKIPRYCA